MDIYIRPIEANDYEQLLTQWWKDWRWAPPPRDALPQNGTGGLIVMDGDTPVCAGFVYVTNSSICWVEWIVSNFNYKNRGNRKTALVHLVDALTRIALASGGKYCYFMGNSPSLIEVFKINAYSPSRDKNMNELIRRL